MNKISLYNELLDIFEFKTIHDNLGNELVILKSSTADNLDKTEFEDKTTFEVLDSHVHIINNPRRYNKQNLIELGERLGKLLVDRLSYVFPDKHFMVFVVITDSMIIRFHQKWENEPYYYYHEELAKNEVMISFDSDTGICRKSVD